MGVKITQEMRQRAKLEAQRRDPFIHHHFNVAHMSGSQRDEIGFLGEFACCQHLGLDWEKYPAKLSDH